MMYRYGHIGIVLLVYAPFTYVLLTTGHPTLAILCGLGILAIEPLPDRDFRLPFLSHRGISHSLFAALLIGLVMGAVGWLVGRYAISPIVQAFQESSIIRLTDSENILRDLRVYDAEAFSLIGFAVGVFGVIAHLLGDMITISGIRPFLPFSHRHVSLSSVHSDSLIANSALFVLGILAITIVVITAIPSVSVIPATSGYSPVDVAASQPQSQSNTTVEITNQTSNGSTVTIRRATLPEGGFIAIHESGYIDGAEPADSSIIAVSKNLSAGTHRNITVEISNAPPGNFPGLNRSRLSASQTVVAVAYRDTNGNGRFDFVRTVGSSDAAYTSGGAPTSDVASVTIPRSEQPRTTASVTFADQTMRNNTLVVKRARLPDGGFIVAHNENYRRTGDPLTSAVGLSRYLPPGNHSNITVDVLPSALNRSQTVTVRPAMDTNDNQRYDYVRSDGFQNVGYSARNQSMTVAATAQVSIPGGANATQTTATTATSTTASTSTATSEFTPALTPGQTTTGAGTATGAADSADDGLSIFQIIAGIAVLVVIVLIIRWIVR